MQCGACVAMIRRADNKGGKDFIEGVSLLDGMKMGVKVGVKKG